MMAPGPSALEAARSSFPFVAQAVYLNTATAGLAWQGLGEASAKFYEAKLRGICGRSEWVATAARARASLAALLGVEEDAVSFTGSATEALNLTCLGLPLPPGSRVAIAADEFPSVWQACLALRKSGIDITPIEISSEGERSAALAKAASGRASRGGLPCPLAYRHHGRSRADRCGVPRERRLADRGRRAGGRSHSRYAPGWRTLTAAPRSSGCSAASAWDS